MNALQDVAGYVEKTSGLRFSGPLRERMLDGLRACAARRGHVPGEAYRSLLEQDPAAFDELIAALTVPETHFFREAAAVALLQQVALPAAALRSNHVSVWSAGCASGEEAYTVAMAAAETGLGHRVRVLGTDLSSLALTVADGGVYGRWSLRGVNPTRRRRWFEEHPDGFRVPDTIRRRVRFHQGNLLAGPPGRFDIVLCRNVLLYLTP